MTTYKHESISEEMRNRRVKELRLCIYEASEKYDIDTIAINVLEVKELLPYIDLNIHVFKYLKKIGFSVNSMLTYFKKNTYPEVQKTIYATFLQSEKDLIEYLESIRIESFDNLYDFQLKFGISNNDYKNLIEKIIPDENNLKIILSALNIDFKDISNIFENNTIKKNIFMPKKTTLGDILKKDIKTLGDYLKDLTICRNVKINDIAFQLKIKKEKISKWVNDEEVPTFEELNKLVSGIGDMDIFVKKVKEKRVIIDPQGEIYKIITKKVPLNKQSGKTKIESPLDAYLKTCCKIIENHQERLIQKDNVLEILHKLVYIITQQDYKIAQLRQDKVESGESTMVNHEENDFAKDYFTFKEISIKSLKAIFTVLENMKIMHDFEIDELNDIKEEFIKYSI